MPTLGEQGVFSLTTAERNSSCELGWRVKRQIQNTNNEKNNKVVLHTCSKAWATASSGILSARGGARWAKSSTRCCSPSCHTYASESLCTECTACAKDPPAHLNHRRTNGPALAITNITVKHAGQHTHCDDFSTMISSSTARVENVERCAQGIISMRYCQGYEGHQNRNSALPLF